MYVGQLVELATTTTIFERPLHPYTAALIRAVPVPDPRRQARDVVLRSEVPSPLSPPSAAISIRAASSLSLAISATPRPFEK
jgi:oligopeptide/dipeptide ABC transporter ATP-binding protein